MAAAGIAFEASQSASEHGRGACPSQTRPIDLVHLATQTMGDRALEIEVLQMFARQARRALHDMATPDADAVVAAAHRLKGAANAVGAFRVSAAAQGVEFDPSDAARRAAVSAAVVEAENFIKKLYR